MVEVERRDFERLRREAHNAWASAPIPISAVAIVAPWKGALAGWLVSDAE